MKKLEEIKPIFEEYKSQISDNVKVKFYTFVTTRRNRSYATFGIEDERILFDSDLYADGDECVEFWHIEANFEQLAQDEDLKDYIIDKFVRADVWLDDDQVAWFSGGELVSDDDLCNLLTKQDLEIINKMYHLFD